MVASELHPDVGFGRCKLRDGNLRAGGGGMTSHVNHGHSNELKAMTTSGKTPQLNRVKNTPVD